LNQRIQLAIESGTRTNLGLSLQSQLGLLRSRCFVPTSVFIDPKSAFNSRKQEFVGVELDLGGANDYASKVDAKIMRINEAYQCIKHGFPINCHLLR
jgi:hypothetical protein